MDTQTIYILLAVVIIAYLMYNRSTMEGWRPFAWYGYPGETSGSVGYQARGDWCGIVPSTTQVDPSLPLIPPDECNAQTCYRTM